MKNTSTIVVSNNETSATVNMIQVILRFLTMPIQWLQRYYTQCINEAKRENGEQPTNEQQPISIKKTLHLLHIQVAFLFAAFATTTSLMLHLVLVGWFIAVLLYKVE